MGRGLSDLQRWILRQTFERGTVTNAEICQGYFGWPDRQPAYCIRSRWDGEPVLQCIRSEAFSPQAIGHKHYHVVTVTISRAIHRLGRRGLVWWDHKTSGSPMRLTEQGQEWYWLNVVADNNDQPIERANDIG
jgi:hypothetical protein